MSDNTMFDDFELEDIDSVFPDDEVEEAEQTEVENEETEVSDEETEANDEDNDESFSDDIDFQDDFVDQESDEAEIDESDVEDAENAEISSIEQETGNSIDVESLSYNRLMNHIKYMVARIIKRELLHLNMNSYMQSEYPESFAIAENVCRHLGKSIGAEMDETEIGYLAMHIERVCFGNLKGQ